MNDRIHLSGKNGSGKTTLLKILLGEIKPSSGEVKIRKNLKIGYIDQEPFCDQQNLFAIEYLRKIHDDEQNIFRSIKNLGFIVTELNKPISKLSRGQRTKLAVIEILLENNDLIILDEPTNHLDLLTREKIEQALEDYCGALIVVSHDKYFAKKLRITKQINL